MSDNAAIPVLYDETHREKRFSNPHSKPQVGSMASFPNLLGYLEHHTPDTDGSFAICVAAGNVTLVTKVREFFFFSFSISHANGPFPLKETLRVHP
jgi:hypothetical protein